MRAVVIADRFVGSAVERVLIRLGGVREIGKKLSIDLDQVYAVVIVSPRYIRIRDVISSP